MPVFGRVGGRKKAPGKGAKTGGSSRGPARKATSSAKGNQGQKKKGRNPGFTQDKGTGY